MNLLWILSEPPEMRDGRPFSVTGSDRLRCLALSAALSGLGHRIAVMPVATLVGKLDSASVRSADAVIVAKQFADIAPLIGAVKDRGVFVVVDLCDDVLQLGHLRDVYAGLLAGADATTAASPVLAERIRAHYGHVGRNTPVAVVPDCVEGAALPPAFDPQPDRPLRLLWFGQPANLDALDAALPELGRALPGVPLALTIVTKLLPSVTERFPERPDGLSIHGLAIRCLPWSPDGLRAALRDCDLVIVPSFAADDKLAKSSNRVATALWAGRLPVAFPLPSYQPFAASALLAERVAEGIAWALAHPEMVPARIAEGQALIRRDFTPAAVAARWSAVLTGFLAPSFPGKDRIPHAPD